MKKICMSVAAAAALFIGAAPAQAALVETVTVNNTFGYNFVSGGGVAQKVGGDRQTVFLGQRSPTPDSDLGIDYVGEAGDGQFFFLHNNYCVGACSTGSSTVITFTVTNTGNAPVDLRFDSLITPGHLARVNGPAAARGGFNFTVTQRNATGNIPLYSASGNANDEELLAGDWNDLPFNGQVRYVLPGGSVLDWDTTPLNLELGTLAAGATTQVEYAASYFITSFDDCADILACGGLQVVFGDPRNNGSIRTLARGVGASAIGDPVDIINREYDAVSVPYAFNISGSPFPTLPPGQGPVDYRGTYVPLAVPEPSTWAMMLIGFGVIGASLRRNRSTGRVPSIAASQA